MSHLVHASGAALADAIAQMMSETHRLDAWSFWTVPGPHHLVVAGDQRRPAAGLRSGTGS